MQGSSTSNGCPCCAFVGMELFLPESERAKKQEEVPQECAEEGGATVVDLAQSMTELLQVDRPIVIVDTHGHAQLHRDRDATYDVSTLEQRIKLQQLACAVEPCDFSTTLDYAAGSDTILPALGVHPWYIETLLEDSEDKWLQELERLLVQHPRAIVGEIGLCKIAKWTRLFEQGKAAAMGIQTKVMQQQMRLAAKLKRPVTVHCVSAHGVFVKALKELVVEDPSQIPPAIGMHSFTGTAHHVQELLDLEKHVLRRNCDDNPPTPPLFYFGFSHAVNYAMCLSEKSRKKGMEAVRAVPADRLMVESDVHHPDDVLGGTVGAIAYVAAARNESVVALANATARNGMTFLMQRE
jgi:TatD DNase family protein